MLHILKLRLNTMLTRTDFQTSCRVSESIQNAQTHSWPWSCERQHIHPSLLMSLSTTTIEKCYYCERKALKSCCFLQSKEQLWEMFFQANTTANAFPHYESNPLVDKDNNFCPQLCLYTHVTCASHLYCFPN